jgi:polar amino acid transport system substrate-binding protein
MKKAALTVLICLLIFTAFTGCDKSEKVITSFDDAQHATIGVMIGTTGEKAARERFPKAEVKSFDDIMDAFAALKSGQLDAVVTGYPNAVQAIKHNPGFWILPEPLQNEDSSVAIKKGNDDLLSAVNALIAELKADGTLADMKKRWFKPDLTPYEEKTFTLPVKGKVLKIGVSATREPFNFVDKNGRVTGHDGELARRIAVKLHRPIEFSNMKFMALLPALQSGKVDMIVTGMTATDERRKAVDFSQPYFANAQIMMVKKSGSAKAAAKNESKKLASPDDLKDKRIGVLLGSVHDTYATKHYPKAIILQYKSPPDLVMAIKSGKIDAAFYTTEVLLDMFRSDKELGMVGNCLFSVPIGIGFNKNNGKLREQFNQFLRQVKENGVFDDMVSRWITRGSAEAPEIKNTKTNGLLTVGIVSDKGLPFTIVKNNKIIGFDIELAERFAAHLGKELKLKDMDFGALIPAVATNKIDMIDSTVMITEERKKQIDFSDPYYALGASVFALKKNIAASGATAEKNDTTEVSFSFFKSVANSFYINIIHEKRYLLIFDGLKITVVISILATIFGTLLGGLICFMRMSRKSALNMPAKVYISILRGTPVLVLLMLIFYVVFASVDIDPVLVAVIAFAMNFAAYVAEIFRTGIEGVDKGQTEAGIAMGFTKIRTFLFIILPQTVRRILPVYKGEFISLVKMTSVVGYIAVQDLTKASDIIRSRTFDAFFPLFMVAILYFLISWLLMLCLGYVERITDPKFKRRRLHRT